MNEAPNTEVINLTAEIVSAYVAKNSLPAGDLPGVLKSVHDALIQLSTGKIKEEVQPEALVPAVPIKKSITEHYLISLETGQHFKSLKRHLMTTHKMTPQQYREKWGLPKDYPMVAPGYAASRSALAKSLGLGRKAMPTPAPEPTPVAEPAAEPANDPAPAKRRGRAAKAA